MKVYFDDRAKLPDGWAFDVNELPLDKEPYLFVVHRRSNSSGKVAVKRCLQNSGAVLFVSSGGLSGTSDGQKHFLAAEHSAEHPYPHLRTFLNEQLSTATSYRELDWARLYHPKDPRLIARLTERCPNWRVLSYRDSFADLWHLEPPNERTILVWDEIDYGDADPLRSTGIRSFLSPYDWAVALECRHGVNTGVLLLDRAGDRQPACHGRHVFSQFPDVLPWLKVRFAEEEVVRDANTVRMASDNDDQGRKIRGQLLKKLWSAALTQPGDRHAIANLIGPRLLLRSMERGGIQAPLEQLLHAVGLMPDVRGSFEAPWHSGNIAAYVDEFILIDDMAKHGWQDFVTKALGSSKPVRIVDRVSLGTVDEALKRSTRRVVLLDLRLFSNSNVSDEIAFLRDLLGSLNDTDRRLLGDADVRHIEAYCSGPKSESLEHHVALSLFPRWLSLRYPRVPVILFSSARHPEILTRVPRTVVQNFDKPRFTEPAATDAVVAESRWRFEQAVAGAEPLARGQDKLLAFARMEDGAVKPDAIRGSLVELFLDESGSMSEDDYRKRTFVVGGMLLGFTDENTRDHVMEALWHEGLVWGEARYRMGNRWENRIPPSPIPKMENEHDPSEYRPWLERFESLLAASNVDVRAVALAAQRSDPLRSGVEEGQSEVTFREQLGNLLEGVLFDILRDRIADPPEVRIHVATRTFVPVNASAKFDFKERFQVGWTDWREGNRTEVRCYSFSANEVWPLYATIRQRRKLMPAIVTWARGATLKYEDQTTQERADQVRDPRKRASADRPPAPIHHLADWISRFGRFKTNGDPIPEIAETWFKRGFCDTNPEFLAWLEAARLAQEGSPEAALATAVSACHPEHRPLAFHRWVVSYVAQYAGNLSAEAFAKYCSLIT